MSGAFDALMQEGIAADEALRQVATQPTFSDHLVVRPGDTLVLRVDPDRFTPESAAEMKRLVTERLSGVEVMVLGVDQMFVHQPDAPAGG